MNALTRRGIPTLVAVAAVVVLAALSAFAASGDTVADRVLGQGGSFTTNAQNNGGLSASSLVTPSYLAFDGAGRLFVADFGNNRVLEYDNPLTSPVANRVFGQGGSFTASGCNTGGIGPATLCAPMGVAVDNTGRLFVADGDNNRVIEYDTPLTSQSASRVYGQPNFTSKIANFGGVSATSLSGPRGVVIDSTGRLYIADAANNRVLAYDTPLRPRSRRAYSVKEVVLPRAAPITVASPQPR